MTIEQIHEEQQKKLSAMFEEFGVFFAFSKQQFEQSRKEGVEYVSGFAGMIIPKDNVTLVDERLDHIHEEAAALMREHIPMEKYILYELYNHEAFYTGEVDEVLKLARSYYPDCTLDDIYKVYRANNY
ncbi:hypothetical protein AAH068_19170 [Bacteroides uniformis]|uniref:DUF7659 family protein n=1 Tax=Bacteroides uniformis TaxID=820 RepID=UPI0039B599BA